MKLGPRRNYHEGRAALRHYTNQTARPSWLLRRHPNFTSTYLLRDCTTSPINRFAALTIGQTFHMQQNMSVFTAAFLLLNISHNDIIVLRGCLSSSFNFTCPNNASFPGRCSKHALDYTTLWGVKIKICSNNKSPLKRSYWDNKIWSVWIFLEYSLILFHYKVVRL